MSDASAPAVSDAAAAEPAQAGAPAAPVVPLVDEGVGATLTRAREAAGLSLDDCAQQLKYPARKLEALEKERYDELPGGTFARGMLRAYARLLNLDADAIVRRVSDRVQVQDTTDTAVSLRRPIPFSEAGKRGNMLYAVLSVAALAVMAWAAAGWFQERRSSTKMTFVPAAQAPATAEAKADASPATASSAPATAATEPAAKPAAGAVVAAVTPTPTPIPQEPAKPAAAESPAADAPPAAGQRRLVMHFERDSWVEVRTGDGKRVLQQTIAAGTQRTVDGRPPFSVTVGNASHVRLTWDDKPVKLVPHAKTDVAKLTLE